MLLAWKKNKVHMTNMLNKKRAVEKNSFFKLRLVKMLKSYISQLFPISYT